jgi:hypothetical protein
MNETQQLFSGLTRSFRDNFNLRNAQAFSEEKQSFFIAGRILPNDSVWFINLFDRPA